MLLKTLGCYFGLPGIAYIQFEKAMNSEELVMKNERLERSNSPRERSVGE